MPIFILQPLVENAIRHGIHGRVNGVVAVTISMAENRLAVVVRDNGKGLPMDWDLENKGGIGLKNVAERLDFHFQSDHHLRFNPGEPGCTVSMSLPILDRIP